LLPLDHYCPWREEAERLAALIEAQQRALSKLELEFAQLKRHVVGPQTEKIPPPESEIDKTRPPRDSDAAQRKRRERAEERAAAMETKEVEHRVPDEQRLCPHCGKQAEPFGEGKRTVQFEYVPGKFICNVHVQETVACTCGEHIVRAEGPRRLFDQSRYGTGFVAYLATSKCGDSLPIYRIEKQFLRLSIPIGRSTLNALFLRAGQELKPIYDRMLQLLRNEWLVQADETSIKVQTLKRRGFVWTFLAGEIVAYVFSGDRSGLTPARVLGGTQGTLVVDGYTGYNIVTDVAGRERAGCWSHARRKFFEALDKAPEARVALDLILELFRVEHDAAQERIVGKKRHLAMRRSRAGPALDKLRAWLEQEKPRHAPGSAMAVAVNYCLNQWDKLTLFLGDARIPIHNNSSERALRVVALGRKNFLFFGNEQAGEKIAVLYSLVASCEAAGVSPIEYLTDVLVRIQTHPRDDIDALLPHKWAAARA
jgi:transposase